ncbi:FAD-binding domain-containing protein [Rhizodiscina lignyota]|uniref:FAD-binding domain-containing protein n=1 Tax=Rhizodiscina lignyota TaxID=1504668 RepID=A0A9P4M664_9PEZI|nr:FAD-binding domain-containing protein [Rhizodiscina lignyota]
MNIFSLSSISVIVALVSCHDPQVFLSVEQADGVALSCTELQSRLPDRVFFQHSVEYDRQQNSYWLYEQAHDYQPRCRIAALDASDVSVFIETVKKFNASFAVRSGGHSFLPGASNIDDGITLDLSGLNKIELSEDKKALFLQPGATWLDVYRVLERHNLSAVGGRSGSVGVGGYVLGGGSSYHSNRYGWSCDSALVYEILLANGSIVMASAAEHPDLFWALKGGGNNFGIVTGVRMATFQQGVLYIVIRSFSQPLTVVNRIFPALEKFTHIGHHDPDSSVFLSFAYTAATSTISSTLVLVNAAAEKMSPSFKLFDGLQAVQESRLTANTSTLVLLADQTSDFQYRKLKFTLTFQPVGELMRRILKTFESLTGSIAFEDAAGVYLTFQPLTASHISHDDNALGLSTAGPLMLLSLEIYWTRHEQSEFFHRFAKEVHNTMKKEAEDTGSLHRFVYLNYAAEWQDPFIGYGLENLCRLKEIQDKYDPDGIFSILQQGGKKINACHIQCT